MANAKKCDRCGRLYHCYKGVAITSLGNKYNGIALTGEERTRCYDLCQPCMNSLAEWLDYEPYYKEEATNEDK